MIRQVRGTVLSAGLVSVTVEVAGFGMEVFTPAPNAFPVGKEARLFTHLAVKQDGLELYGFSSEDDLAFFELVLSVSGIGTKTALSVLRKAPREALEGAIGTRDLNYLTKIAGLGKKSAEKMLVELSEKVGPRSHAIEDSEVFDTLVALGYTEREARSALKRIPDGIVGKDQRLKAALSTKA